LATAEVPHPTFRLHSWLNLLQLEMENQQQQAKPFLIFVPFVAFCGKRWVA